MDLTLTVPPLLTVRESHEVESRVRELVMARRREVRELKIHIHALEEGEDLGDDEEHDDGHADAATNQSKRNGNGNGNGNGKARVIRSDFGRDGC